MALIPLAKCGISPCLKIWPSDLDIWPWKSIGFQILLRINYVPSLVKIHWRMLILEFTRMLQKDGRTQYFRYIMATSLSGGRSRSTWREPPTMGKQLVNLITCGCKSSAPFFFSSPVQSTGSELMSSPVGRRPMLTFAFSSNVDKLLDPGWWNFTCEFVVDS
jgi:hypothetical protein